jgi:carboxylesterase
MPAPVPGDAPARPARLPDDAAAPYSACDGPVGVLVLHGLTATVGTVLPLADALADAGFSVEAPLLPGHGTSVEDLERKGFADWLGAADEALVSLGARCDQTVVAGHSLGGTLALALALEHPEIAGLVLVNPFIEPPVPAAVQMLRAARGAGQRQLPAIGSDVAKPGVVEDAYHCVPVASLLSLFEAVGELAPRLGSIVCPVLLMTSRIDHVVPASHAELLAASLSGPLERVVLERSYHVATLDYDACELEQRTVAFVQKCCA